MLLKDLLQPQTFAIFGRIDFYLRLRQLNEVKENELPFKAWTRKTEKSNQLAGRIAKHWIINIFITVYWKRKDKSLMGATLVKEWAIHMKFQRKKSITQGTRISYWLINDFINWNLCVASKRKSIKWIIVWLLRYFRSLPQTMISTIDSRMIRWAAL